MDIHRDLDPLETSEWLDALKSVVAVRGPERANFLLGQLLEEARRDGLFIPQTLTTAYKNTIPPEREIPFPDLGEIYDPTWAPDGQSIAFSALVGGYTDLYVYDLRSGTSRRLTNDAFADLQPAWSPDGRTIAFVTDRFSSRMESLSIGNYRLATIDPGT